MGRLESGIGVSTIDRLPEAAREAALDARQGCADPAAVVLFATDNYDPSGLAAASGELARVFPAAPVLAGGTVPGVCVGGHRFDSLYGARAVAVLALGGDGIRAAARLAADAKADPVGAGRRVAEGVRAELGEAPAAGLMLSPSVIAKPRWVDPDLVSGVQDVLPDVQLAGGGLGGGMQGFDFPEGHAFLRGEVAQAGALLVGFAGLGATVGVANGFSRERPAGTVTSVLEPNVIGTIDGAPARDRALALLAGDDARAREFLTKNALLACVELGVAFAEADPQGGAYWPHIPVGWTAEGGMLERYRPCVGQELVVVRMDRSACLAAVDVVADLVGGRAAHAFDLTLAFSCSLRTLTLGPGSGAQDTRFRERVSTRAHLGVTVRGEIARYRGGRAGCTVWSYAVLGLFGSEASGERHQA